MSPFELLIGGTYLVAGLVALATREYSQRRVLWRSALRRDAARDAGLSSIVDLEASTLAVDASGLHVRLSDLPKWQGPGTRVEIEVPGLAHGLTLRPEPAAAASRSPREIEIGDEEFDREVALQGPPAVALSVLDSATRHAVRTLVRGPFQMRGHPPFQVSGWLVQGVLGMSVPEGARFGRPRRGEEAPAARPQLAARLELAAVVRAALELARRLVVPGDVAARLASHLASERNQGVRLRIFVTLQREFRESEAARDALRAALADENEQLRLRAGLALGAEGREVLMGLAAATTTDDATSAAAVGGLADTLTLEQASGLLRGALRTRRLATATVCLRLLGAHGKGAVPTLAKVLAVEKDEVGAAAAQALAATGDPSAEAPLLRALAEGSSPEVRRAAITGLGRVGTRDAVAPLRDAEAGDPELRRTARQAVAMIQARLAGAAQGQLSLAGESGRLSIAQDESGRLSLSPPSGEVPLQ